MTARRWVLAGIVFFVLAQALVWFSAGFIWWTFRGGIVWPGEEPSPSRIARDSYVAIAFFVVAAANVAVLVPFLARPSRRSTFLLAAIQAIGAVTALAFTLVIDTTWISVAALAAPTSALLLLVERRLGTTTLPQTKHS